MSKAIFLGVKIHQKVTWKPHIEYIKRKCALYRCAEQSKGQFMFRSSPPYFFTVGFFHILVITQKWRQDTYDFSNAKPFVYVTEKRTLFNL